MMRLRIAKNLLSPAVTHAARAVPARATAPIHTGLLVTVADEHLTLSGFDPAAKVSAESRIPVPGAGAGTLLLPAHRLRDIVSALPGGDVELDVDDDRCKISAGRSAFTVPRMPVDQYPALPRMPKVTGTVPAAVLSEAVAQVAVAAAADAGPSPVLGGVRIEANTDRLLLVATDRYRVAVREIAWDVVDGFTPFNAIVPAKALTDVVKTLGKSGDVTVSHTDGILGLSAASMSATIGEIAGEYPAWRTLFAGTVTRTVTVDSATFAGSANRVSTVMDSPTPLRLEVVDGAVRVSAASTTADGVDVIDAVLDGDDVTLGINPAFLRDGLAGAGAGKVRLDIISDVKPLVITADGDADFRYLVMPMKLNG